MESIAAVSMLSALGHEGRLEIFRLLVRAGASGRAAGDIARELDVRPNTLSANLSLLSSAGLVLSRREGRSVIYAARYEGMQDLLSYLVDDCCEGRPEICQPIVAAARPRCEALP